MHTLTEASLSDFTGSATFTRWPLVPSIALTEGAMYVAEHGGANWLIDKVTSHQIRSDWTNKAPFQQSWKLTVADGKGLITVTDGDENEVYREVINYTDFPLPVIELWVVDKTVMLPGEY